MIIVHYDPLYFCGSDQFSCSVISNSLLPHGLQHAVPPCPSPTPGVYSNSCSLSWWWHPTISSIIPFSSHLQSFPASGSFQMSQFFASGGQSIGVSASASVIPMNIQDWLPLGWTAWLSLLSKGLWRLFIPQHFCGIRIQIQKQILFHFWFYLFFSCWAWLTCQFYLSFQRTSC